MCACKFIFTKRILFKVSTTRLIIVLSGKFHHLTTIFIPTVQYTDFSSNNMFLAINVLMFLFMCVFNITENLTITPKIFCKNRVILTGFYDDNDKGIML